VLVPLLFVVAALFFDYALRDDFPRPYSVPVENAMKRVFNVCRFSYRRSQMKIPACPRAMPFPKN
jgi:hypothetical protein